MTKVNTPKQAATPKLVPTERVAEVLGVLPETVLNIVKRGDIPHYRASRKVMRYDLDEVLAHIARGHAH